MAFDVQPVYDFLLQNGCVYTVRPTYLRHAVGHSYEQPIHIHRNHKWDGNVGTKKLVSIGQSAMKLIDAMKDYVGYSGFLDPQSWYAELSHMHGAKATGMNWGIYLVQLEEKNMEEYCGFCGSGNVVYTKKKSPGVVTETVKCSDCGQEGLLRRGDKIEDMAGFEPETSPKRNI